MVRTFSMLFLFLSLVSCGKSGSGNHSENSLQDLETSSSSSPAPTMAQTFDVNAVMTGFSKVNEDKVLDALELIKKIVASDAFKSKVLNFKYNGKKTYANNNGLTNAQIYQKILEGSENFKKTKNNTMDLVLQTYYTGDIVIGYTEANIKTIYLNTRYLSQFEPYQVAMNLTHEWLHKLGFGHDFDATAARPYSVPYAIGYLMRDLAKKY